jgi:hypothetical protein
VQLPLGIAGGLDGSAAGGQAHLQGGPLRAGLGLGQPRAGEGVAGGAFGVDRIGLGPGASGGALGAVQFDDQLVRVGEVAGQSGAVAAGIPISSASGSPPSRSSAASWAMPDRATVWSLCALNPATRRRYRRGQTWSVGMIHSSPMAV